MRIKEILENNEWAWEEEKTKKNPNKQQKSLKKEKKKEIKAQRIPIFLKSDMMINEGIMKYGAMMTWKWSGIWE